MARSDMLGSWDRRLSFMIGTDDEAFWEQMAKSDML
jgi:hypothetical protein